MQRCVAPRRSALSLSLLTPSSSHIPKSWRALRRCILHSTHARTSVEASAHAHRADRTQQPDVTATLPVHTPPAVRPPLFVPSDLGKIDRPSRAPGPPSAPWEMRPLHHDQATCEGRRRRMCRPPCSLVRHACLELRRLMPTGWSCQVGAGLLGLITSTFFPPFRVFTC